MFAIYKRELKSYFTSAIGYIVIAIFVAVASFLFYVGNLYSDTSDMSSLFANLMFLYVFLVPILTMRIFSEEKRQKTDQALLTAPVSLFGVVFGKFLAAFTIYAVGLSCTVVFGVILGSCATVDAWAILGNIIAMLLVGAAFIAIGLFVSNLTESQIVAVIVSFILLLLAYFLQNIASLIPVQFIGDILTNISVSTHYSNFSYGIFSLSDAVYYISVALLFVFFTVRMLEKRRWS
jgi:ABC-2 type transporter.